MNFLEDFTVDAESRDLQVVGVEMEVVVVAKSVAGPARRRCELQ